MDHRLEFIKKKILELGSQAELARILERKPQQITKWLKGEQIIGEKIARDIEDKLELHRGYLDKHHDNQEENSAIYISHFDDHVAKLYAIDTEILKENGWNSQNLRVLRVTDTAMGPLLTTGMLVLVDTTLTEPENDLIYAIKSNNDITIRRMIKQFGTEQFIAKPENMRYESYPYTPETQSILGRVVYKLGEKL